MSSEALNEATVRRYDGGVALGGNAVELIAPRPHKRPRIAHRFAARHSRAVLVEQFDRIALSDGLFGRSRGPVAIPGKNYKAV
jgi:hypothetical protein